MRRRALLATTGLALAGGCTARPSEDADTAQNDTTNDSTVIDSIDTPSNRPRTPSRDRDYFVIGFWLNEAPDDVDPYPTDDEPLESNEVLQAFFDDVVAQDLRPGTEDDPSNGQGKQVVREITPEERDQVIEDLQPVEFSENDWHPGLYVNHDGTYVWLVVVTPD